MSGSQDGSLAVSDADFLAALTGGAESDTEPTAATPEPVQPEAPDPTPATAPTATPTEPQAETPAETPPAQAPDELATLRAAMAELRQEQERQRGTYDNNTRQQREALEAAKREADTLRQQVADAASQVFERQRQAWESQYQQISDPQQRTAARAFIDAEVKAHEAEHKAAEAQRLTESFAPVVQQLEGLRVQNEIATTVQRNLGLIQGDGAEQLAREVGADVAEVRAYLQRPDIAASYQQIFALMKHAELTGQPVPVGLLSGIGGQHRAYWAEKVADRRAAEDRQIQANQRELVASGATRADGGGGAGAPPKSKDTFGDITNDDFAAALGLRR